MKARSEGKLVSIDRKRGECNQWKAKGECTDGNACSFRHDGNRRGKSIATVLSCSKTADSKRREKSLKGKALKGRSPSGKG